MRRSTPIRFACAAQLFRYRNDVAEDPGAEGFQLSVAVAVAAEAVVAELDEVFVAELPAHFVAETDQLAVEFVQLFSLRVEKRAFLFIRRAADGGVGALLIRTEHRQGDGLPFPLDGRLPVQGLVFAHQLVLPGEGVHDLRAEGADGDLRVAEQERAETLL